MSAAYLELASLCRARGWVLGVALNSSGADDADDSRTYEFRVKVYDSRPIRRARVLADESAGADGSRLEGASRVILAALRMAPPPEAS